MRSYLPSATIVSDYAWGTVAFLFVGSYFLILLDICGGLPFLMSVKPSERTEMSAIYSSFRDVSGILTPGIAWLILTVAPVSGIFLASGIASLAAWKVAEAFTSETWEKPLVAGVIAINRRG